jgi:hypothetical protein
MFPIISFSGNLAETGMRGFIDLVVPQFVLAQTEKLIVLQHGQTQYTTSLECSGSELKRLRVPLAHQIMQEQI